MADRGINSPHYKRVLENYDRLTEHLQTDKEAKKRLFAKFVAKGWYRPGDCPSENELVNIALKRIEHTPSELGVFIDMLEQIAGTEIIVQDLKGKSTLYSCLQVQIVTNNVSNFVNVE